MAEQIAHTKNGKIEQFGRICFYAGLLLELLIVILDKSSWINPLEGQMFRVSFLLFACKLCVTKYSKKEWLAVLAAGVIAGLCYLGSDRDEAVRAVVFVASMKGIDHKKALRVNHNIPAHKVWVRNRFGEYIPGITASKPPHFMTEQERKAPLDMKDITVDVGAVSKEEAVEKFGIRIGEPVVPDVTFTYSETTDLMVGKSFDCRLGCAAILKTMHTLAGQDLNVDIVGACAAQEEVGVRGATVTAQVIKPDIAIVFEGCPADDTCVEQYMVQTAIKRGPMLRHIDSRMITNPRYQRYALDLAEKLGIPVQDAVRSAGSTNGAVIHLTEKAVPVIVIGVPVRYAHTHYGISAYADFDNAVKLACEILKRLDEKLIMSF